MNELEGELYRIMNLSSEMEDRKAAVLVSCISSLQIQLEQAATEVQTVSDSNRNE